MAWEPLEMPKKNKTDSHSKQASKGANQALLGFLAIGLMLLVSLIASCSIGCSADRYADEDKNNAPTGGPTHAVSVEVSCEKNLLFSKYDIDVYVDGEQLGTIDHGSKDTYELKLSEGKHTLRIAESGSTSVDGKTTFKVPDSKRLKYTVKCTDSQVEISEISSIHPPVSLKETKEMEVDEVVQQFKQAGFSEVSTDEIRDLKPSESARNKTISKIQIAGSDDFNTDTEFHIDDEVVITYHVLADIPAPASSEEMKKMDYEAAAKSFKDAGFANVSVVSSLSYSTSNPERSIKSIRIGGEEDGTTDFLAGDTFPYDAQITIEYYSGSSSKESGTSSSDDDSPLTVDNSPELAAFLAVADPLDASVSQFVSANTGKTIEFDGNIAMYSSHDGAKTRFDFLIHAGDYSPDSVQGPEMQFEDCNIYDLNTDMDTIPQQQNVHIVATILGYNSNNGLVKLSPQRVTRR